MLFESSFDWEYCSILVEARQHFDSVQNVLRIFPMAIFIFVFIAMWDNCTYKEATKICKIII